MTSANLDSAAADFSGQVAMITGAGRNIGLGVARRLGAGGAAVVLVDINQAALDTAVGQLTAEGITAVGVAADVSSRRQVQGGVESAVAELGEIDVLVNSAAIWYTKSLLQHSDEEWDRTLAVNLTGTYVTCTTVLPSMIRRGHGAIINIASIAAYNYTIPHVAYAASKAGVSALTRDLAYEVAEFGVRVNGIAPGNIPKEPCDISGLPIGSGTAADIANVVAFLASPAARYVIGMTLPVAGGGNIALNYGSMGTLRDEHLGDQQLRGLEHLTRA
jgi:NAD(P)-dependent dehydrogenase (short-subunit alcohol dehydrogenase family)